MELQDLKQKWNMLDERLSKSEVYNKRALEEIIKGKNKTAYEKIYYEALWNLFATIIFPILVYILHIKGIFHDTAFYTLEAVCAIALLMVICRLTVISGFNVMKSPAEQLRTLVNYKRCYVFEVVIGVPLCFICIFTTIILESTSSMTGLFFIIIGLLMGLSCAYFGWQRHKKSMYEIEHNLAELKNFE